MTAFVPDQKTISPDLSAKFTVVSFVSACFVVVLHAYDKAFVADGLTTAWIVTFVGWTLPTFAVPIFFAISGYLLGVKSGNGQWDGWYADAVRKRARTLLVPYLVWCTIYAVTVVPFAIVGNRLAGRSLLQNTHLHEPLWSWWNLACTYGADMTGLPSNGVLWYVRNLMVLVLMAPLLVRIVASRWTGILWLLLIGIPFFLYDWLSRTCWQFFETGFSLRGLLFFSLGLFLAAHPVRHDSFRRFRPLLPLAWIIACLAFTCLRLHPVGDTLAAQRLLAKAINILGVGAVWVLYDMIPCARRLVRLPFIRDSFFIYAAHLGIMATALCARAQDILAKSFHVSPLGVFFLRIAVPLLVALALAEFLKRFLPRAYSMLTGGRR